MFAVDKQRLFLLQPGSKNTLNNLRLLKTEHIKVLAAVRCRWWANKHPQPSCA